MDNSANNSIQRRMPIEPDMHSLPYDEADPFTTKIFKTYPLVGDYIISDALIEKWHNNTKTYIDRRMDDKSLRFKQWVYEQVALTVIHYAKTWNSNEEGRFTRYIAMQLGYKDDSGRVWSFLSEALEKAFKNNNRLFIRRNGDREFYETVMVHSFGPNKSWYPLIDLLFSFYTVNLEWTFVANDPLFVKLVHVLQHYFDYSASDEDQYLIASGSYRLRVGIRRLVQTRPEYCVRLFESIVRRIHQLLRNEAKPSKRYLMAIVDQWFADKISNVSTSSSRLSNKTKESAEVALDYSNISIRYYLNNDRPVLRIPAIRLLGDETGDAYAVLYDQDRQVASYPLDIHGNELGETIRPKTIDLPNEFYSSDELRYRLVISRGASVLHDTEKRLWRSALFFSDGKEISSSRIRRERYEVYVIHPNKLGGTNLDITPLPNGLLELALHKNYSILYAGNTIAIDYSEIQDIRIVAPSVFESAFYQSAGIEYSIPKSGASLKVYCADKNEARKYSVLINGTTHPLTDYYDETAKNRCLIDLEELGYKAVDLSVIDIAAGKIVFKKEYYIIPGFRYEFSKGFYVTSEEIASARVSVICDNEKITMTEGNGEQLQTEYENGVLFIDIPCIKYTFQNIDTIFFNKYCRVEDLEENSCIRVVNKTAAPYTISINGFDLLNPTEIVLKNCIPKDSARARYPITLEVEGYHYVIAELVCGAWFITPPTFVYANDTLKWDGGIYYIGDALTSLVLFLNNDKNDRYCVDLTLDQQIVGVFAKDDLTDGYYDWSIFADDICISSGNCFIGNQSKARFSNRIIYIDRITEDTDTASAAIDVKPVYIDQIKYIDTCYVPMEDDVYDVYTGCMYWTPYTGEKRYLSFKDKTITNGNRIRRKYKVNPVKIIYVSDRYLRIVTEDDEGIYCFDNQFSLEPGYEITDIEPARGIRGYLDVLFYLYHTEEINPSHRSSAPEKLAIPALNTRDAEEKQPVKQNITDVKQVEVPPLKTANSLQSLIETDQSTVINASVHDRILVNAGPGTGKTWTLIEKIIKMVQTGTDPETIQMLCFSRAAVEVIRNRMSQAIESGIVDVSLNLVDIRTFDSFASQVLYWVRDSEYEEIDQTFNIERLSYEERILLFVDVLRAIPELIEQCEHLIVDEVQDLVMSRAKMVLTMIELLPDSCGVTLFGDACQAIYDYQVDGGMSSTDFYKQVEATEKFTFYSFSKNYRQVSQLQTYCESYRKAILAEDISECNAQLERISEQLPDYNVTKIRAFEEDSLDTLVSEGNVGLLTRSNAEALMISSLFRKKGIPHTIQRRLSADYLSGWIATLFNTSTLKFFDKDSFVSAVHSMCSDYFANSDLNDIWDAVADTPGGSNKYIKAKDLLRGIKKIKRSDGIYVSTPVASVTVSTIHRSKGREYDSVILLDSLISERTNNPEEQRVNYVALSRAKQRIYKVSLGKFFFKTLTDRRSYSDEFSRASTKYLSYFETGKPDDFVGRSFCENAQIQDYIRKMGRSLVGKELFLQRHDYRENGNFTYDLIIKSTGLKIARTSDSFAQDLDDAIHQIKNLPPYATVYDNLYPKRFSGLYISDVASEISMLQGNEMGVKEYDGLVTWNTVLVEGYAKAEY